MGSVGWLLACRSHEEAALRVEKSAAMHPDLFAEPRTILSILLILGLLPRLALLLCGAPVVQPDTTSYAELATQIARLDFHAYTAIRTPVYPLFMLLCGMNYRVIMAAQFVIGLGIAAILFTLTLRQTKQTRLAFLAGLLYSMDMRMLYYEANIMPETLTAFWIVLSVWVYQRLAAPATGARGASVGALGLLLALAGLTRPLLLCLVPVYLVFLPVWRGRAPSERARLLACYLVPILVPVGAWAAFNKVTVGYFEPSSLTGFSLLTHSGQSMRYAPEKYARFRDIYLRYEAMENEKPQSAMDSVTWASAREMMRQTGLSHSALSGQLTRLSLYLFAHHPVTYLKTVVIGWGRFWISERSIWGVGDPTTPNTLTSRFLARFVLLDRALVILLNILFLGISGYTLYCLLTRRRADLPLLPLVSMAVVLSVSVAQALTEYGSNPRYSAPFYPLVLYVVVSGWAIWRRHARGANVLTAA
jgi:4-amino-4-deoxy-L-arabinose transferase-like glycosyltransferase